MSLKSLSDYAALDFDVCLSICVYTVLYSRCTTERDREIIQHGEIITVFDRRLWADSLCVLNDQLESLIRKIKCLNLFFFFLIQERYIILTNSRTDKLVYIV